ncbi:MAG TPA: lipid-binding SYLF domain-containing protein, partial [Candidatus Krumholzibacteria bacterium]|nr:lipid-binding SYLF domain-containing protein [Candidatus Krumholzibacteria bacterium]
MRRLLIPSLCVLLVVALAPLASGDDQKTSGEAKRINDATSVLAEFSNMSEGAPASLTQNAAGVVVIPGLLKAGFMVGGKHGSGVLSIKNSDGTWSEPVFVKLTGGSIGWQIGVSSTDLVLFFMREKNIRSILDGEFTVGADATVAAGPVGRTGSADTSAKLDA